MFQHEPATQEFQGNARCRQGLQRALWAHGGVSHDAGEHAACANGWKSQPRSLRRFFSRDCWGQRRLKPWYARAVTNGGPGAAALEYSDEGEEAKDPPPTAEGDSSEDEKPVPEDGGPNTRPSEKPVWRALGRWWKLKSRFLCSLSPTRQRVDSVPQTEKVLPGTHLM